MRNAEVAALFDEIADLLEIEGGNPFRVRAYRNAARTLSGLGRNVSDMVEQGADLDALPGIGPDLAAKITALVKSGSHPLLDQLRKKVPPGLAALLRLPGLGPKRVRQLHERLGVASVEDLHRAAQQGRISQVPGFGKLSEQHLLEATASHLGMPGRFKRLDALALAGELLAFLRAIPQVDRVLAAGSLRRGKDSVGDLDLLVTGAPGNEAMPRFTARGDVQEILQQGPTRASVHLKNGMQVDLRMVAPECFGAAAVYFTGSKAHNIALRRLAQERGLKLNEYGVFRGKERVAGDSEESVYQALGLAQIEPELREDRGELEAARQGSLPHLVQLSDLRGDLHVHTKESDGHDTLEAMVAAAQRRGLSYLAITEHSRRLAVARGLDPVRLGKQIDRIDRLNATLTGFTVLKGIEVDILEDGSLDLPDSILSRLDLVVAAVHQRFDLSRSRQTDRLMRAMANRYFTVLAHPSGRLIGERPPMDVDLLKIVRGAKQRGCFLELNSQPSRLDLDDAACQMSKAEGVAVCISSDAHSTFEFDFLEGGVIQARRGWLEPGDVLNTRSLETLRPLLKRTMGE